MKAQGLRIGNILNHRLENKPYAIETLSVSQGNSSVVLCLFGYKPSCTLDFMEPIPLTAEWLTRFSFKKIHRTWGIHEHYVLNDDCKIINNGHNYFLYVRPYNIETIHLIHVHQLQNLYYVLTGKELTLK